MESLYKNPKDEATNLRAIEKLARKVNQPLLRVKAVYEIEFARLKIGAKVPDFIGVIANRRACEILLDAAERVRLAKLKPVLPA
jgi:hypothetical protein